MKIDGRCHCGAITYEAEIDPSKVIVCHCADCQTLSGSAFRVSVPAEGDSFRFLSGRPTVYVKTTPKAALTATRPSARTADRRSMQAAPAERPRCPFASAPSGNATN